jgi:anti-sigma regulatory factor (Ser/Thr protein kinase)
MHSTHVLVIDSDRERAGAVAQRVRSDAWEVSTVIGTDAARAALAERPIAVALADSTVWRDDGLAKAVAAEHPALPVILLAAQEDTPDRLVEQLQLGAMTFVPRNAGSRRLVEAVRTLIDLNRRDPHRAGVRPYLRGGAIELHIPNDPGVVPLIVGYVQRILEDYGLSAPREQTRIGIALTEALANAIIHGNLGVGSEMRDNDSDRYYALIDTRRAKDPYRAREVHIVMRFSQSSASFVIRDMGKGFDRAAVADPTAPENLLTASGRGLLLMRAYCDAVSWNDSGNEVTLTKVLKPEPTKASDGP